MISVWKAGRIYEYDYSGFISTGMMGIGPKISGGSITGRLTIEPVDEHTINIAVSFVFSSFYNQLKYPNRNIHCDSLTA